MIAMQVAAACVVAGFILVAVFAVRAAVAALRVRRHVHDLASSPAFRQLDRLPASLERVNGAIGRLPALRARFATIGQALENAAASSARFAAIVGMAADATERLLEAFSP